MALSPDHPLLAGLVDDAAVYPPGSATMPDAAAAHRAWRKTRYAPMVGRFLCPASRLGQLQAELAASDHLPLGLIADAGGLAGLIQAVGSVGADPRLDLRVVEVALPADEDQRQAARLILSRVGRLRAFVELPRVAGWRQALTEVAAAGQGAKLRTGGLVASAFPSEGEVAAFVVACAKAGVPFKCTAGLHHAIRHTDPVTGFDHHGFLNIVLAAAAAVDGAEEEDLAPLLSERDAAVVVARTESIEVVAAARARLAFVSYGTCSLAEPVDDLGFLGLLEGPRR